MRGGEAEEAVEEEHAAVPGHGGAGKVSGIIYEEPARVVGLDEEVVV